jgi:mono/diheme cytochrome c family protein
LSFFRNGFAGIFDTETLIQVTMKYLIKSLSLVFMISLMSCGGTEEKKEKEQIKIGSKQKTETKKETKTEATQTKEYDLSNNGVGPVKSLVLPETIDQAMVATGQELFKNKCTACHKPDKKFIGPAPTGIFTRRAPAWVMNMILNPDEMVKQDPDAKQLLIENNGSPMANQSLTEAEARAIVEYFRTLE